MKFRAYAIFSAAKHLGVVEAKDKDEAKEKAWELDTYASLCHQCADEIELGDAYEIQIEVDE